MTMATMATQPLRAAELEVRLLATDEGTRDGVPRPRRLSDDGFADAPATLALSDDLSAGFTHGDLLLSYRGLSGLNLSTHAAWNLAATNLINRARREAGVEFYSRDSASCIGAVVRGGIEMRVPDGELSAWVAHPKTFAIMNRHAAALLGAPPAFIVPSRQHVFAVPHSSTNAKQLAQAAQDAASYIHRKRGARAVLMDRPFIYHAGFPMTVGSTLGRWLNGMAQAA